MQIQALSDQDIQRIHAASLEVLSRVGVQFHKAPQVVEFLVANGCRTDGQRVYFPPELVAECLQRVPDRNGLTFGDPSLGYGEQFSLAQGASHFTVNGNAFSLFDHEAGRARDCVEADADDFHVVGSSLKHLVADPCDMIFHSERSAEGKRRQATFDDADARGGFLRQWLARRQGIARPLGLNLRNYSHDEGRLVMLGLAARDGAETLAQRMSLWEQYIWFNPLSPLQWHAEQSPIFLELLDPARKCTLIIISPEIMMGATCPVTMAGALAQHNAEVLSGVILAQLARPGVPVMYGFVGAPMDLRVGEITHGNTETGLLNIAASQLANHYGLPCRLCPGNPSAKAPGVRAAVETALGMAMGMAAGGNIIMTGILDSTLILSYEHLLIADEIAGQLANANSAIQTDAESLAVDVIAEHGHVSPGFVYCEHTLKHMKRDVYYSDFVGRVAGSYEDWYEIAHRKVKTILSGRDRPIEDAAALKRLAAVEARLAEDDQLWRAKKDDWWRFYVQDFD